MDANRRENQKILDIRAEKRFELAERRSIRLRMNLYNALNANAITGTNIQSGGNFGQVSSILLPRLIDFGVQYVF